MISIPVALLPTSNQPARSRLRATYRLTFKHNCSYFIAYHFNWLLATVISRDNIFQISGTSSGPVRSAILATANSLARGISFPAIETPKARWSGYVDIIRTIRLERRPECAAFLMPHPGNGCGQRGHVTFASTSGSKSRSPEPQRISRGYSRSARRVGEWRGRPSSVAPASRYHAAPSSSAN